MPKQRSNSLYVLFQPLKMDPVVAETEPEENLGPLEPPFDSPKFRRNFSILFDQVRFIPFFFSLTVNVFFTMR